MDAYRLKMLLAVARCGSFSKAALDQDCTQPAITWNMNRLEDELGLRLLVRTHGGIRLTPEGEALLPAVQRAVDGADELEAKARSLAARGRALVLVGSLSSIANRWLPQAMRAYRERDPAVSFEISIGSDSLRTMLINHQIDLALGDAGRLGALDWHPLWEDPFYVAMPAADAGGRAAVRQDELTRCTLLVAPFDLLARSLDALPSNQIVVNCEDSTTLLGMVAQGLGVSIMTRSNLANVPAGVVALPLVPRACRSVGVALSDEAGAAARAFAQFVIDDCAALSCE